MNDPANLAAILSLPQIKTMTRQWSRGEKWLFVGTGIFCLPLLVGSWVYERQNELPPPPPQMAEVPPTNNAFDLILQAMAVSPPFPYPISTKNGCKSTHVDIGDTCPGTYPEPTVLPYTPRYNVVFPLKRKIAYLKSAQKSLKLWRQSLSLPLYVPATMSTSQDYLWHRRGHLMIAARTQSRACWQRGDNKAALDWLLNCHRELCRSAGSASNLQYQSIFLGLFDNIEKQRTGIMNELELLSPYLNASQSRHAALELQKNRSESFSRVDALKIAKAIAIKGFYQACQGKSDLSRNLKFRWANKKRGLAHIERQWNWLIEQEKLPLSKQFLPVNSFPSDVYTERNDIFWDLSFQNEWQGDEHRESLHTNAPEVVWETAMAVRAFALDNGRNPLKLNELVPKYLKRVENDPFSSSQQLRYSPNPKTYTQWFKGKPIYTKKLPTNSVAETQVLYAPSAVPPPSPTGYYLIGKIQKLPFLLYSVGGDERDGGGMDFKAVSTKPTSTSSGGFPNTFCDDIVAPVEWFQVPTLPESAKISLMPPAL